MDLPAAELWRLVGEGLALTYRAAPGYDARLTPDATLVLSGEAVADLNYAVIGPGPRPAERLEAFARVLHEQRLPGYVILSADVAGPLVPAARALGLQPLGSLPLMTCGDAGEAAPTGDYGVVRVEGTQDLRAANAVAAAAFGLPADAARRAWGPAILDGPGVDVFLAWRGAAPVAALQTTRFGAKVGIWAMGTAPLHQRRGAGRAVLGAAMAHHRARGAALFYLGATEAGRPLYERAGFRTVAEGAVWAAGHERVGRPCQAR